MVIGIEKFSEYFSSHKDKYAIIGGTACDLLFDAAGLPFRETKDIDMVLCVEVIDLGFGEQFGAFLKAGGYKAREKGEGRKQFFRFHLPTDKNFPYMIELFSRKPETLKLPKETIISRVPADNGIISLSAILLEDDYYHAIQSAKRVVKGVTILDETLLIPFKARAFLDLTDHLHKGLNVNQKHIKKHCNDIFRLLQLLPRNSIIKIAQPIQADLRRFLDLVEVDKTFDPRSFDVKMTAQEGISLLRSAYQIKA